MYCLPPLQYRHYTNRFCLIRVQHSVGCISIPCKRRDFWYVQTGPESHPPHLQLFISSIKFLACNPMAMPWLHHWKVGVGAALLTFVLVLRFEISSSYQRSSVTLCIFFLSLSKGIVRLTYLLTYLRTYLLAYSMEQSPSWEANRFAASHEIPRISWNPKVH